MAKKSDIRAVREIVKKYLFLLQKLNVSFDDVYIYGSYARGNPHKDSDIDIAIIARDWGPDIFDAQLYLMKIAERIDSRIEPRPIRKSDLRDPDPFIEEIIRTGKIVKI